jgi:hypothetical protein
MQAGKMFLLRADASEFKIYKKYFLLAETLVTVIQIIQATTYISWENVQERRYRHETRDATASE